LKITIPAVWGLPAVVVAETVRMADPPGAMVMAGPAVIAKAVIVGALQAVAAISRPLHA
jgi:hypothetical protein